MKIQVVIQRIFRILIMYPLLILAAPVMVPMLWIVSFLMDDTGHPVSEANDIIKWYASGMKVDWYQNGER